MYISTLTRDCATNLHPSDAYHFHRSEPLWGLSSVILFDDGNSQLQRWSSIIGIVTAIVGNILISFALNIQRYAHIRLHKERLQQKELARNAAKRAQSGYGATNANGGQDTEDHERYHEGSDEDDPLRKSFHSTNSQSTTDSSHHSAQAKTYLKSPYWWGGIILMTIGETGNFLAYGFAPASIVSPLGVVALISNCVIAPIMLKERFRLRDFWGVLVAVAGAVTVVLSAKHQEKKFGPHEVWGAITTLEFEIYMAITVSMIAVLVWASPRYGNKTILIDLGLVGLFGGYTALSTKGVASMLSSTLWRALTTPVTYALLAVLIGTAVMQVRYVNKSLQRFDSTQVIPVQFVMFTLSVIIGSAVLYRDFEKTTPQRAVKFFGGCLLTFFGVFLITSGRPPHDDMGDEDQEVEGEEERIGLGDQEAAGGETARPHTDYSFDPWRTSKTVVRSEDGTCEDAAGPRRSSRVSFAAPSSRPRTPRMYSDSSQQSTRVSYSIPPSESNEPEQAPLLRNPWGSSAEDLLDVRRPGMPSSSQSARPLLEAQPTSTDVQTDSTLLGSHALPLADRPVTPVARHSISRMIPGPFISPLSGGLSVVVADTLRRSVDVSRSKGMKRSQLALQRSKSGSQRLSYTSNGTHDELGDSSSKYGDATEDTSRSFGNDAGNWSPITRTRSLSNTLGDLLRGKRYIASSRDEGGNEEAGPSGS
ncbi:Multidrug resistance efflux transporter EmrE [Venustampulla echinocandica]|uniref:Multidrug resistance efflux transporter EmrE n=1 Tax=Venustampulla echinocandica TaxID=2656787 RepID=A0A370TV19_9HELO|nr:Multidrug resistance efflux transporter EmrE [Venustampulla echinocandica]RDL39349.1 Multidrug resistance efflux transporter EmrE [Venustampulla echinocandica]